jgi:threonine synthase
MKSYLTHLECTRCGKTLTADEPARTCPDCGKVLYARYDLDAARREVKRSDIQLRAPTMWRYFELMPVRDEANIVTLGEGFTPILRVDRLGERLGSNALYIKDEGMNPTASFKARGMSAAVSKARELGLKALTAPSAGNAGGALAAYAARAGMDAHIFMPRDAPEANRKEVEASGAHLTLVDGLIGEAGAQSGKAAAELGLFDVSTLREPYRAEGKKTMGYEIAEQMGWEVPDAIVYPTGGGTGIVAIWKALDEMATLGWIGDKRPRMFCVQAEGCAPMVRAFHGGAEFAEPWENARTIASGMRVPAAIGDYLILRALRESGGGAVAVTDPEMLDHMKLVASTEGLFICPEGAATAAGAARLLADGTLSPDDRVLLLNTGSGLKYLDLV